MSKRLTPLKAIRQYCVYECSAGSRKMTRECTVIKCPLHPFRMGKNPNRKKNLTAAQSEELRQRAKRMHHEQKRNNGFSPSG